MAVPGQSGWRPTLPDSLPQALKDAIRISYERHDRVEAMVAGIATQSRQTGDTANKELQTNSLATQEFLTVIPGFKLLQAGSSSQLKNGQGSILPIAIGSILYDNSVANTVKWYFTGLTLLWPDGSSTPIPDTSVAFPSIIVSGLAAGSYLFYPRYKVSLRTVQWAQVAGGVGTPPAAFVAASSLAAQYQNQDGAVAISLGSVTGVALATAGGGGGSGGGRSGFGKSS